MKPKLKFILLIMAGLLVWPPALSLAQMPSSTNYQAQDMMLDFGGGTATSASYSSMSTLNAEEDSSSSSSTYKSTPGFTLPAYPGVPPQPTLTNTGGTLYNSLDFVLATSSNSSDTNYAIALSSNNFATTYFVQTDDTLSATTTAWQSYALWGGTTGQRITGLTASTTYQIKVKARYGPDSETAYSKTASASTTAPNFVMTIAGVAINTSIAGATTTVTSGANSINFGAFVQGVQAVAAQQITVTTNAASGYTTTIQEDKDLTNAQGATISPVGSSNASPGSFPSSVPTGAFGYHTTDASLCTGTTGRFSVNDTYAAVTTAPLEISCNSGAVTNESTYVVYKALTGQLQASGSYSNTITYISTGKY